MSKILLVEDDAPLASMVADFLAPHGFDVSMEGRGDTAVDRIIEENPDAVILDINLPGLDGFSVCKAVRPNYRGPIIMLTARGEEVDEVVGLQLGADDRRRPTARGPTQKSPGNAGLFGGLSFRRRFPPSALR